MSADVTLPFNEILDCKDADYTPQVYARSDVKYTHIPFDEFFTKRHVDIGLGKDLYLFDCAIIAGGFPSRRLADKYGGNPCDIDCFFRTELDLNRTAHNLLLADYKPSECDKDVISAYNKWLKPGAELDEKAFINLSPPQNIEDVDVVQLVKIQYFPDAESVIDCFDFTCIQFAFDMANREIVFNPVAPIDYAKRSLVQHRVESRDRVLKRVKKYQDKGFRLSPSFILPEAKVEV